MTWFRLYPEFATDPKVQSMPEAMQRRLVMLFCLECSGDLPKLEDHELALAMRITPKELDETRRLFTRKGFINGTWSPKNWEKRQEPADAGAAKRMRELRERRRREANELHEQNRNVTANVTRTSAGRSGPVTPDTRSREGEEEQEKKDFLPSDALPSVNGTREQMHACEPSGEVPDARRKMAERTKRRLGDPGTKGKPGKSV
jgi:hypothetical protein